MSAVVWRWEERDFGFRFRNGRGRRASEYYQARWPGEFYVVPSSQRKLTKSRVDELAVLFPAPSSPRVVGNPWHYYERGWDWIKSVDGICLNWAGCLDKEEIDRREDEGVQRAMELVADLVTHANPIQLSIRIIQQVHVALMEPIYPFAGAWRTVGLHRGEGTERWPLPPGGIQPQMDVLERDVLARSPVMSDDDQEVFMYASEVMNELIAIHPFREGNGRAAFILGNLILMQNNMLPLTIYERWSDEARYFAACEAGRIHREYAPLAALLGEWEDNALAEWERRHG